jgi:exopolyphosphatase/guanosine-5'-triphosphate,3'-diphosphate pyrophosphatase
MDSVEIKSYTEQEILSKILEYAKSCNYAKEHSHQVTKLALQLFDNLVVLHRLGPLERSWLHCASLLHDIGWVGGRQEHHKRSRDMIIAAMELPYTGPERMMIGLIARYHRRGLPKDDHKYYSDLGREDKMRVNILAALLRIADGLDRGHVSSVQELSCVLTPERVIVKIKALSPTDIECKAGKTKADLLEKFFEREVVIEAVSQKIP